jgi:hypothetical protein
VESFRELFAAIGRFFYRQWCRAKFAVWVWWMWLRYWTVDWVSPPPDPVLFFKPEFNVLHELNRKTIPIEDFFRLKSIAEEIHRMVGGALGLRAEALMIAVDGNGVGLKYYVDGVERSENFEIPMNRQMAGEMIDVFRLHASLKGRDFTPRQHGQFEVTFQNIDYYCQLQVYNHPTGDRQMVLWFAEKKALPIDMTEQNPLVLFQKLGMRGDMLATLREVLSYERGVRPGMMLISAPRQHGFNATFNSAIKLIDPYVNRPIALEHMEDVQKLNGRLDPGVTDVVPYDARTGRKPHNLLIDALEQRLPRVVCMRRLNEDSAVVEELCHQPDKDRLVIGGIEAKDALDALLKIDALMKERYPDGSIFDSDSKFLAAINVVLNQRLVRRLCDFCREQYQAPPQMLRELGLPDYQPAYFWKPGRPPVHSDKGDRPCPHCGGTGYNGRTAIFEMLVVDDCVRKAASTIGRVNKEPKFKDDGKKDAPKKLTAQEYRAEMDKITSRSGHLSLAEEGICAAAAGITSIDELRRVGIIKEA